MWTLQANPDLSSDLVIYASVNESGSVGKSEDEDRKDNGSFLDGQEVLARSKVWSMFGEERANDQTTEKYAGDGSDEENVQVQVRCEIQCCTSAARNALRVVDERLVGNN